MARRGLSRRGLFELFRGRGAADGAASPPPPDESRSFERVRRVPAEVVQATARPGGVFLVEGRPLAVGESVRVESPELFEAVVVARVDASHVAACSSECPLDASDLVFDGERDGLVCPACESLWRLDGEPLDGPAGYAIASYVVEAHDDAFRIVDR